MSFSLYLPLRLIDQIVITEAYYVQKKTENKLFEERETMVVINELKYWTSLQLLFVDCGRMIFGATKV